MISIAIEQFFKLTKKYIDNNVEIIINKIIKAYSISNKTYKTDKKDIIVLKVRYSEIIQAL